VKEKQLRAHVNVTLARWGERLVKQKSVPYLLLGLREIKGRNECILCCGDETPDQVADVLRQVLGELERQIVDMAYREGVEG
jgi:hypothetical protein